MRRESTADAVTVPAVAVTAVVICDLTCRLPSLDSAPPAAATAGAGVLSPLLISILVLSPPLPPVEAFLFKISVKKKGMLLLLVFATK